MAPLVLHMFFLRPFGHRHGKRVIARGQDRHAEAEAGAKVFAFLHMQGLVHVGQEGVVTKQGLPQSVLEIKADDGTVQGLPCPAIDTQGDDLAAGTPAERSFLRIQQQHLLDTGASLAKSRSIRVKTEYLDIVAQARTVEEILPGIPKVFLSLPEHQPPPEGRGGGGCFPLGGFKDVFKIKFRDLLGISGTFDAAMFKENGMGTQAVDGGHVMADEEQRLCGYELAQESHAFLREKSVSHGQGLVHDKDVRIHMGDDGKGQAHDHAAGIVAHRLVDEVADIRKVHDGVVAGGDLVIAQPQDGGIQEDVLAPGETFFLTDQIDNVKGTAGDDVFKAPDGTMGAFDTVDGGAGNDTLEVYGESAELEGTYTNIENLVIMDATTANNNKDIDLSSFSGSFTLKGGSDTAVTVTNVAGQKLVLDGVTSGTTLTAKMDGTQTSVKLVNEGPLNATFQAEGDKLASMDLTTNANTTLADGNGNTVKNVAITALADATITLTDLTNLENVTVAGAGAVELTVAGSVKTVDASANAGGVTVDLSSADEAAFTGGAGKDSITVDGSKAAHDLGAGDDTLIFTSLDEKGSVEGGEGTDTISVTHTNLTALETAFKNGDITGFEVLSVSNQAANGVDMAKFSGIDHLVLEAGIAGSQTIANMQSGSTLELTADAENNFAVTVAGADKAADDVLNIVLSKDAALAANTVVVKDVETINIVADDSGEGAADATHTMTLTADKATTVKVSGDAGMTLTLTGSDAVKTINASESTGNVTISDALKGVTFTGGAGDDTVTLDAGNTVTGGAGDDTFTINLNTAVNDRSVITDFGAGDTIKMGSSANGSGADNALGDALVVNDPKATLDDYVNAATQAEGVAWFQYEGNTYVVVNDGAAGFDKADYIVQLSGSVDLSDAVMDSGSLTLGA